MARRGLALPLIVAAVAALTVLAIAFVAFTQGQGRLTHRAAHGEIAYHLALSGVDAGLAATAARMRPGGALEQALAGLPAALEATSFELDGKSGALAALLAALEPGTDARVSVTVSFRGWHSFYPVGFRSPAGTIADPVEKAGFVEVVAKATCGGAAREVSCLKAARVIRPALPVLPRFTLFVKRPPEAGGLALTEIDKRASYPAPSGAVAASATHDALVLYNAPGAYAAGELAKGWLDRSGWVFLGSTPDTRWVFDLAYGGLEGEPFGESFQLTKQAMWVTADAGGNPLATAGFDRLVMRSGVHGGLASDPLFARLSLGQERGRAASVHLFGSHDRPSPTAVLGRVYRRSLIASYLGTKAHDRVWPLPYAGLASLEQVVRDAFGDRADLYAKHMSRAVVEPYARSFDHVEKNLVNPTALDAFDPPYALVGSDRLTQRLEPADPDPGRKRTFLYAVDANARVKLAAADRRKLFDGDLGELATQDLLLPERTTHVFRLSDFRRWTEGGRLRVRGIMALDPAEPDLAIERPLEVEEGGVLVVRGSIDINADITGRPLTLVALEGRIRVRAARVHARLVALGETGVVERAGDGDLELVGGVAASRLDVASLARGAQPQRIAKTLTWDPRGDDVAPAFYMDRRRVVVLR